MAWLYKRGDIWWIGWRVGGKVRATSTKQTARTEAEKKLKELELLESVYASGALTDAFVESFTGKAPKRLTFPAAAESWLKESIAQGATKATELKYRQVIKEFSSYLAGLGPERTLEKNYRG
jgi:hypothetical protein